MSWQMARHMKQFELLTSIYWLLTSNAKIDHWTLNPKIPNVIVAGMYSVVPREIARFCNATALNIFIQIGAHYVIYTPGE
jgi:hypothetical protein